ncbi:MAG: oligosaccharide flippase family protein [Acidobacteria bacterium]|nr:oligosaccharide flippase family protein [Acidobacteriota bacterium]
MDSTLKPTAILMSGRLIGIVVAFAIPVVLARLFDQATFGTYKQLFLVCATLYGIAQCGMAESLFYFLPSEPRRAGSYAMNALVALSGAGTVCLVLLWAGRFQVAAWLGNDALAPGLPWIGAHLALMLASAALEIVLTSRQRFLGAAGAYAGSDVVRTALCLAPALLLGSLEGLLIGAAVFAALRFGAAFLLLRREFGGALRFDASLLKTQLAYALPFELAVLVEILQGNLHQYAVSLRFDAAAFAVYSVGCLQVPLVDLVAGSTCNVMMVRMAEDLRDGRREAALLAWHGAVHRLALVFLPLVGMLLLNARDLIVLLFTRSYLASVPIFMLWAGAFVLAALPVDGVLRVYADTRFLLFLGALKLIFIAATVGWFLGRFHLEGGVLVTLAATAAGKTLALGRIGSHLKAGAADLLPWRGLAAILVSTLAAGLPAFYVKDALGLAPLPSVLASGLVYAAAYAVLAGGFHLFGARHRLVAMPEAPK